MSKIYLYHEYKTPEKYQAHLKSGGKSHDNMVVAGVLFTMDEYDQAGRTITYGNLKKKKMLTITTADRYGAGGFADAEVEMDELIAWRNDICYIE